MAKKRTKTPKEPAASIASIQRRRRPRRNPAAMVANPPMLTDLKNVLLPGFGAFALTRVLSRVAYALVSKRWPKFAKHAHAGAGVLSFGGAWFLGHRWSKLAPYHDGIIVGSGIAAMHGLFQAYVPQKYGWLLADPQPGDYSNVKILTPAALQQQALAAKRAQIQQEEPEEDDENFDIDIELDRLMRNTNARTRARHAAPPAAPPRANDPSCVTADDIPDEGGDEMDPELAAILGDEKIDGIFAPEGN